MGGAIGRGNSTSGKYHLVHLDEVSLCLRDYVIVECMRERTT